MELLFVECRRKFNTRGSFATLLVELLVDDTDEFRKWERRLAFGGTEVFSDNDGLLSPSNEGGAISSCVVVVVRMKVNSGCGGVFCSSLIFSRFFSRSLSAIAVAYLHKKIDPTAQDQYLELMIGLDVCATAKQRSMSRVSSAIFIQRFGSFNSQGTTVIAESFFDEIERHLFGDEKKLLGDCVEAVQYAHERISRGAAHLQRDASANQPQASNDLITTCHITFEQNQNFLSAN